MDAIFYPLPIGETGDNEKYLEDFQEEHFQEEDFQQEDFQQEVDEDEEDEEVNEYPSDLDDEYPDSDYYDERSDRHWSDDDSDRDLDDLYDEYENYYEEVQVKKQNLEVEIIDIIPEIEILNQNEKEKFNQVEDKLTTLSKNLTCIICLTNQVQILTIPCGHLIMCNPCSLNLNNSVCTRGVNSNYEKCPKCRTPIYNKIIARLP